VRASINYTLGDNVENLQLQGSGLIDGTGNALNNVISGTFLSNVISGLDGADRLYGFSGSDHLYGGDGDDRLEGGAGDDVLDGGNGTDQLSGDDGQDILRGGAGDDTIDGGVGIDALYGDPGRDTLIGDSGDDTLNGGAGIDRMIGGVGNDTYTVDSYGDKTIENEGEGTDRVFASTNYKLGANVEKLTIQGSADLWAYGNGLDNTLIGNTGANKLYGLAGNDTLSGGAGADWLEGGAGQDGLSGGADNDSFVFRDGDFAGLTTSTCDEIKDFTSGDKIRLNFVDANTLLGGDQAFSFIGTGAFSNTAGQLRYEQISGNTYVEGDTNGDGIADFMIKLDGLHTLVGGDFGL
jgi:Ca2+-binding RTX toxin-like protein